jgi:transposase-like protein
MDSFTSPEARATQHGPWDPKLQTPESRKALVDYAKQHGIKPAMRHFGCSRNTIRKWLRRFEEEGQTGLKGLPRGRRPKAPKARVVETSSTHQPAAYHWPAPAVKPNLHGHTVTPLTQPPAAAPSAYKPYNPQGRI